MNSNLQKIFTENFPDIKTYTSIYKIKDIESYTKLTIVRNPFDRLLSLYMDKCREHPRKVRNRDHNVFLQKCQAQILSASARIFHTKLPAIEPGIEIDKRSNDYNQLEDHFSILESLTFEQFIEIIYFLFNVPDRDAHFAPQTEIMLYNGSLAVDKFFKKEQIDTGWEEICGIIGKQILLRDGINRTNYEGPDKYKRFYSEMMKKIVCELYRADFINFNYDVNFQASDT